MCPSVQAKSRPMAALLCMVFSTLASAQSLFPGNGPISAAQAERGRAAYVLNCQACHSAGLEGTQFGPALEGDAFSAHWRDRPLTALSEQIRTTMPPGKLGSLSGDDYADIEAFILQANSGRTSPSEKTASAPPDG